MRAVNKYGLDTIKFFEGLELKAYRCPAGYLTIGYGHLVKQGEPKVITEQQAEDYLREDVQETAKNVSHLLRVETTDNQFSALVSFAYNLGVTALEGSTLLKMHNEGNTRGAGLQFDRWCKARVNGQLRPLQGLVRRRDAEEALYTDKITDLYNLIG